MWRSTRTKDNVRQSVIDEPSLAIRLCTRHVHENGTRIQRARGEPNIIILEPVFGK